MANNDLEKISKAFSSTNKTNATRSKSTNSKRSSNSSNGKHYWGKNYYKNPDIVSKNSNTKTSSATNKQVKSSVNNALNEAISGTISNNSNNSSATTSVEKQIKKLPILSKICIIILFLVGVAISIGICFFVCKNDQFEIIGKKNITINVNETYTDLGVTAIGFRTDMKGQVVTEVYKDGEKIDADLSNLDTSEDCVYQIVYKLSNFRFRDARIVRIVNVVTPVEEEPEQSYTPDEEPNPPVIEKLNLLYLNS